MILTRNSSEADSYYQLARAGQCFSALTSITGLVAFGTAAAMGGPLLWNNTGAAAGGTGRVLAVLLGLSVGWTTAPGASGALGITWGAGQTSAPTGTAAITGVANMRPDLAGAPACNVYNSGTVANAGTTIHLTHEVSTAAGNPSQPIFVPLDGLIVVPPGCWAAVAGAAAIASMVGKISLIWAEVPLK
jgi:hypothetical protein